MTEFIANNWPFITLMGVIFFGSMVVLGYAVYKTASLANTSAAAPLKKAETQAKVPDTRTKTELKIQAAKEKRERKQARNLRNAEKERLAKQNYGKKKD